MTRNRTLWLGVYAVAAVTSALSGNAQEQDGPIGTVRQPLVGARWLPRRSRKNLVFSPSPGAPAFGGLQLSANWKTVQDRNVVRVEAFRPYDIALMKLASPLRFAEPPPATRGQSFRTDSSPSSANRWVRTSSFSAGYQRFCPG